MLKISIITVCFNSEKTIEDTIKSVLFQTVSPYEYIIIDGLSTDSTLDIVNKYRLSFQDKGIILKVISEKDKGLYDAMNKGINMAQGDVIGIVNSDDWYEQNTCELVYNTFAEHENIDIFHALIRRVKSDGYTYLQAGKNINRLRFYMCLNHPSFFVRKEVYERWGGFDLKYKTAADYDFTLRVWLKGVRFVKVNNIVSNMRLGGNSELNFILGLKEKKQIQKQNGITPFFIISSYFMFSLKHLIINLLLRCNINYQKILKKKV